MIHLSEFKSRSPRWLLDAADVSTRAVALATSRDRPLPDFLVIGTKRGGTTSLFNYLLQHPGILGLFPQARAKKSTDFFFADRHNSERWYRSHFHTQTFRRSQERTLGYRPLSFEASPFYSWDPRIPHQVAALAPDMKAIILLRDPVRRAWSHYQERVQNNVEPLSFGDALEAEDRRLDGELERMLVDPGYHSNSWDWFSYRSRGEYLPQLQNWHAAFGRQQLLILRAEDLYAHTQETFNEVCTFLGIPPHNLPTTRAYNATWRTRDDVPKQESIRLVEHFDVLQPQLEQYVGRNFEWW